MQEFIQENYGLIWLAAVQIAAIVGAIVLHLALPKGRNSEVDAAWRRRSLWLGLVLVIALLAMTAVHAAVQSSQSQRLIYFFIFALLAIVSTARVITHQRPIYSALYFVLTVLASAGMLILINAMFLGVAILIVYAGAILVTYVFVIMLATQSGAPQYDHTSREPLLGSLAAFLVAGMVLGTVGLDRLEERNLAAQYAAAVVDDEAAATEAEPLTAGDAAPLVPAREMTNLEWLGLALVGRYAVALEVAGLLLLVAMVGGLAIARRRRETSEPAEAFAERAAALPPSSDSARGGQS